MWKGRLQRNSFEKVYSSAEDRGVGGRRAWEQSLPLMQDCLIVSHLIVWICLRLHWDCLRLHWDCLMQRKSTRQDLIFQASITPSIHNNRQGLMNRFFSCHFFTGSFGGEETRDNLKGCTWGNQPVAQFCPFCYYQFGITRQNPHQSKLAMASETYLDPS